jgi:hypothetical protein
VYYDGSSVPGYTFTLADSGGVRTDTRVRLPAVSCRMIRFVAVCSADFQLWDGSKLDVKPLCAGKGYEQMEFVANG